MELKKLQEKIKNKTAKYLKNKELIIISNETNIHLRILRSLKNKNRILRLYHWKDLAKYFDNDKNLKEKLEKAEKIYTKKFNKFYKKNKNLPYYVYNYYFGYTGQNNYYKDKEDFVQKVFIFVWRRFGDTDIAPALLRNAIKNIKFIFCHEKNSNKRKGYIKSFEQPITRSSSFIQELFLKDILKDPSQEEKLKQVEDNINLDLCYTLTDREKFIIKKRSGLLNNEYKNTLEGLGDEINLSRERVRQIEERAIKKLKKELVYE